MLKIGDKAFILAPSGQVKVEQINRNADFWRNQGLKVVFGENFGKNFFGFAGTDDERLADLQSAFDDKECKALFCARGGYGLTRIADRLNWEKFSMFPKVIVGYSDVTVLLLEAEKRGFTAIHALNLSQYDDPASPESLEQLRKILFEKKLDYEANGHPLNKEGHIKAKLIGGNLSLLTRQIGTPSDFSTEGKILFIEDTGEPAYKIDGMIVHLKRAGKLNKLAGLMTGQFSEGGKDKYFPERDIAEVIAEHVSEFDYPKAFGLPFGHEMPALPMPLGCEVEAVFRKEVIRLRADFSDMRAI
jgi:muramoyltetrapeptide carboxypeptidase